MQTIKIIQRRREQFIPRDRDVDFTKNEKIVDEVTLIEASHITHTHYEVRHDELPKFMDEKINPNEYMDVGNPFNEGSINTPVCPPDYIHRFQYLTYWSVDARYQVAVLSGCLVYIMNDKGQTIDSFGC